MKWFILVLCIACGETPPPAPLKKEPAPFAKELKDHFIWFRTQERQNKAKLSLMNQAMQFCIENPEKTHDELIRWYKLEPSARKNVLVTLGRMRRADDISFFESALKSPEPGVGYAAAQALAENPSSKATEVLIGGLSNSRKKSWKNAMIGLGFRKDPETCDKVMEWVSHEDETRRYHAIRSAGRIGCIGSQELGPIAEKESSEKIKKMIQKLLPAQK